MSEGLSPLLPERRTYSHKEANHEVHIPQLLPSLASTLSRFLRRRVPHRDPPSESPTPNVIPLAGAPRSRSLPAPSLLSPPG